MKRDADYYASPYAGGHDADARLQAELLPALAAAFPDDVKPLDLISDKVPQAEVRPQAIRDVATWLQERGFNMLLDLGGVDYLGVKEPRFEVVYHFLALPALGRVRVRVPVGGNKPTVPSLHDLYGNAAPAEREVFDQFGIEFEGHPNLLRILNPYEWDGHPLRKDYPVQGPRANDRPFAADQNRFHPIKLDLPSRGPQGR